MAADADAAAEPAAPPPESAPESQQPEAESDGGDDGWVRARERKRCCVAKPLFRVALRCVSTP